MNTVANGRYQRFRSCLRSVIRRLVALVFFPVFHEFPILFKLRVSSKHFSDPRLTKKRFKFMSVEPLRILWWEVVLARFPGNASLQRALPAYPAR